MRLVHAVARRLPHELDRAHERNAGGEERPERPRRALDDRVLGDAADDGRREREPVEEPSARWRAREDEGGHEEADATGERREPAVASPRRGGKDDACRERELGVELVEEPGHGRQDEDGHDHDHEQGEDDDESGIEHRRYEPAARLRAALHLIRDLWEYDVEPARRLPGADHVDVQAREGLGAARDRARERVPGDDVVAHDAERVAERRVRRLFRESLDRRDERHAGVEEHRELAREQHEVHRARLEEGRERPVQREALLLLRPLGDHCRSGGAARPGRHSAGPPRA